MLRILAKNLLQPRQLRSASSLSKLSLHSDDDEPERPVLLDIKKRVKDLRNSKRAVSIRLKNRLHFTNEDIKRMDLAPIAVVLPLDLSERLKFLLDAGATHETIADNSQVLAMPLEDLKRKIGQVQTAIQSTEPRKVNDMLPLLTLPEDGFQETINKLTRDGPEKNRIYRMSELLDEKPATMAKLYVAAHRVLNIFIVSKLEERIQLLLKHGVARERLLCNLTVLTRSSKRIERRLMRLKGVYSGELMPWMVHCLEYYIDRLIEIEHQNQKILLPNESIPDLLARRLNVDPMVVDVLVKTRPKILMMSVQKISDFLDFLLVYYKPTKIVSNPNILFFKLETIKRRIEEFHEMYHYTPSSPTFFAKSESEYRKGLAALHRHQTSK